VGAMRHSREFLLARHIGHSCCCLRNSRLVSHLVESADPTPGTPRLAPSSERKRAAMDPLGPQNRMKVWAGLSTSGGRAPGAPISRSALIAARAATFGTTFDGAANRRLAHGAAL
jgi:hypothetical protein